MSDTIVIPSTSAPADPSISDLRKLLADETAPAEAAATTKTASPAGEKTAAAGTEKTEAASETAKPQEPKEESEIDKRFSALSKQRNEAREREKEARQENERLRRELEAKSTPPGPAAVETKPAEGKPTPPDVANWTGTWEALEAAKLEYSEKLADWKVSEALKARDLSDQQAKQQVDQKATNAKWEERVAAITAAKPAIQEAIARVGEFITAAGVADLIKQSEVGPEIVMYMHEHPDETVAMARLGNPILIAREIGRLEAKLSPVPQQKQAAAQPLPKPPASVDSGGAPAAVDLDKCDMATFKRTVGKMLG